MASEDRLPPELGLLRGVPLGDGLGKGTQTRPADGVRMERVLMRPTDIIIVVAHFRVVIT
jgi:hypothetical protein